MNIVIASETSGFHLKEAVKARLVSLGHTVIDVGAQNDSDGPLYFEAAAALAQTIQEGKAEKGVVICGTGAGASLIANKHKGIYCVACESVFTAEKIGLINNANVLAMGARVVSHDMGAEMAEQFIAYKWCEGFAPERKQNNERGFVEMQKIEENQ